jgi:lysophospholipase L1-like esterase
MRRRFDSIPQGSIAIVRSYVLLVLIIIVLSLSGCGGGGGGSGGDSNASPTANAGPDLNHDEQTLVILDGSGSGGSIVTYLWSQTGGVPVSLNDANSAIASVIAPEVTQDKLLSFRLTVTGDQGASDTDDMSVLVRAVNALPTASAGEDQFVTENSLVNLDGTGSDDSDGTIVDYNWEQIGGSPQVVLTGEKTATPSFTAPEVTGDVLSLIFRLTVTDNEGGTDSDEVTVYVANVLLLDDFSSGDIYNWIGNKVDDSAGIGNSSKWEIVSGELRQSYFVADVTLGDPFNESYHLGTFTYPNTGNNWQDYRFSVDVTPLPDTGLSVQGNDVGVMFRYQGTNNYYRLTLSARYGFTRLEKKVAGSFSTLALDSRGYYENVTLRFIIEVKGSLIQVFLGDEALFSVTDSDLDSGTIGLYCQDKVTFDNVLVTQKNNPAPSIIISSPADYSVITTSTLDIFALATNLPPGASVDFVLDDGPPIVDSTPPYEVQFTTVSQGEHKVDAILRDSLGAVLAQDSNMVIGVTGDYYVAIGDSITNGFGDDDPSDNTSQDGRTISSQGYEAPLNDLLTSTLSFPHIVYNEGIGGDTAELALGRIDSILERQPQSNKALILFGTNDAVKRVPLATFEQKMKDLIKKLVDAGNEVWIALIPPNFSGNGTIDQFIRDYNNIITTELTNFQVGSDIYTTEVGPDFYSFFLSNPNLFDTDGVHPNALGHAAMAQEWHDVLIP